MVKPSVVLVAVVAVAIVIGTIMAAVFGTKGLGRVVGDVGAFRAMVVALLASGRVSGADGRAVRGPRAPNGRRGPSGDADRRARRLLVLRRAALDFFWPRIFF
jgi:hypothetical protein